MHSCKNCAAKFPVTEQDLMFYQKMEVPPPTHCPRCRQRRRLAFRNEINFFHRTCNKTGAKILSMYSPEAPYKVYDQTEWWKDDWDPLSYGRDFDFNKPFFEQFAALQREVPRMSLNCIHNENSYYTNYSLSNKNSYLVTTADFNEDCYYGRFSDRNFRCMDFDFTYDSRVCYQILNAHNCERCFFSHKLDSCSELYFCYDMRNCHSCIFSANLRNQSYMIFNKKVSPQEFAEFKKNLELKTQAGIEAAWQKAHEFWLTQPRKNLENVNCENSIGDYLKNSKNARLCFDSYDLQDCAYCSITFKIKDCYDWDFVGENSERCYEMASSAGQNMFCRFCMNCWQGNSNLTYCDLCLFSSDLFGCVGLRRKKYCVLNKQYTKEEYEKLVPRIVEHMKKTASPQGERGTGFASPSDAELINKEFGEFFPIESSPFAYNNSVAFEYYPLGKEEAKSQGLVWREAEEIDNNPAQSSTTTCLTCKKNFKMIPQELSFYKEFNMALPQRCWICRHFTRMELKNTRVVDQRTCAKCSKTIYSTYNPQRKEKVFCEKCYLEKVA